MLNIGLVSSANGLGHTRRLCHLATGFMEMGHDVEILALPEQISKVSDELKRDKVLIRFVPIDTYGTEGPVWYRNGCMIKEPPNNIIDRITKYDLVLTDNSIWPFRYSSNVVLFGYFNWIDYWNQSKSYKFPSKAKQIFEEESLLCNNVKIAFCFLDFALSNSIIPKKSHKKVKLMRYKTDQFLPNNIKPSTEIWLASGTTDLADQRNYNFLKNYKFNVFERESFRLINSTIRPFMIAGRPGMGTIRDCLASGVPLLPIWDNADPELNSNVLNLKNLNLLPFYNFDNMKNIDILNRSINEIHNLNLLWREKWLEISDEISRICSDILSLITKDKEPNIGAEKNN